jgi:hypothetical protein
MSWRALAWGVAAALAYVIAAVWVGHVVPIRILYEGEFPPIPYRWVVPPPALAATNLLPQSATATVPVGPRPGQVLTGDGQAVVVFPDGAIPPRQGETQADVTITMLDPATVAPPPLGMRFDGNAYRVEAVYSVSKIAVRLVRPATIVLRYPIHSTDLLRYTGGWVSLNGLVVQAALQVFATSDKLGVFVAAATVP